MNASDLRTVDFDGLARAHRHDRPELLAAICAALDSGQLLDGPHVHELEQSCAALTGRRHACAVGSGTDALTIALRAAGIRNGDEVIVTAFSFIASASAIRLVGATPVFVDIDPRSYLMDLDALPRSLGPATRALVAVDLFGRTLPRQPLEAFAAQHGLTLIEDAAQALTARCGHHPAGGTGALSTVSFDPSKVIGGIAAGGLVLTDDDHLAARVRLLRCHGYNPRTGTFEQLGTNSRLATANAAAVLQHLDRAPGRHIARARIATTYRQGLADLGWLTLPSPTPDGDIDNHHKFVIRVPARTSLQNHLAARGITTKVHYAAALPDHPALAGPQRTVGDLPNARTAAATVLSLPIHPLLTDQEVTHVIDSIRAWPA